MRSDVSADVELGHKPLEIVVDFVALGEVPRDVRVRSKRKRVEVTWGVDTASRIDVLQPGTAKILVLLQNHELDVRGGHLHRHTQPGKPGTDDYNEEVVRDGIPGDFHIPCYETHLLGEQLAVFDRHILDQCAAEHLGHLPRGRRDRFKPAFAIGDDCVQCGRAYLIL